MQSQPGDAYLRSIAAFIRRNAQPLADAAFARRRSQQPSPSFWFSPQRPLVLELDTHHLFYILIRLEAIGIHAGPLDVHVEPPSRPTSYAPIYAADSDTLSLASFRSTLSSLSLPTSWWTDQPDINAELRFIYSSFTKLPALSISPPGNKVISELQGESIESNAVPLDVFKNLQRLDCENVDPRTLLGWDLLSISLRSLKIRKSGLDDITQLFIGAVLDDRARRQGSSAQQRQRSTTLDSPPSDPERTPIARALPSSSWAFLKHLYLPDNGLTSFPPDLLPYLTSVTHLDLSSNLFVSVPSGLEQLYSLTSLNMADNLIDSVLGIYLNLGQLLYINLSRNRLESLCGLERLLALERIDLRKNLLEETSEIGRLVVLPNISELWIEGNTFVEIEESYRVNCFGYFWKEGKSILLDGTLPSLLERRSLGSLEPARPVLPPSTSPPVVAIETSQPHSRREPIQHTNDAASVVASSGRRPKKAKRIVNLDDQASHQMFPSVSHSRLGSVQAAGEGTYTATLVEEPAAGPAEETTPTTRRSRHSRHQTEFADSARSEARRARQSASMFEGPGEEVSADAYRQTIESLKKDMGESWLKVYSQTQAS